MVYFPFEHVRKGQKEMLGDVSAALVNGTHLLANAPTGIGKTAAVVAPALSYALEHGKTVYFLTPKHTQHTIVIDTLKRIKKKHETDFSAVDIVGKQWTCPHRIDGLDNKEFNEFCRNLKKDERCTYYNNVRGSKVSKKATGLVKQIRDTPLHAEEVTRLCKDLDLCPYEVSVETGKKCDFIVCDYFHIFSPRVRKAFLSKLGKDIENSILIVDEAHNLPERVRSILSRSLSEHTLKRALKEATYLDYELLEGAYKKLSSILKSMGRGMQEGQERYVKKEEFTERIEEKIDLSIRELIDQSRDLGEDVLSLPDRRRAHSKTVSFFLEEWLENVNGYSRIYRMQKNRRLTLRCLDPGVSTSEVFALSHSSILMSGTLLPLEMYSNVLGLEPERTALKEYDSPFPKENRKTLIVPGLSTKYSERNDAMYRGYAELLSAILKEVPGNAAVFFPSYAIQTRIASLLEDLTEKSLLVERQGMDKEEKRKLYMRLESSGDVKGSALLGVQAGSLSEGVDYANNILECVIIVGLPLDNPNLETKALIEYYDFKYDRGWDYGYIYPAMNRVLQSAGRCIRSETDRGIVILMDDRFKWKNYNKCLPRDINYVTTRSPERQVREFFRKKDEN